MKPPNPIQITQIDINLQELHCVCNLSQGGVQWSFNTRFSIYPGYSEKPNNSHLPGGYFDQFSPVITFHMLLVVQDTLSLTVPQ